MTSGTRTGRVPSIELPIVGRRIRWWPYAHVDPSFGTRMREGHPGARPQRLRDRPPPRTCRCRRCWTRAGHREHGHAVDGMDRFAAREAVREELRAQGRHVGGAVHAQRRHCSRCDTVSAPAEQAVVRQGRAAGPRGRRGGARRPGHGPPEGAREALLDWVDNMHDWTISRQLWWGHRIPGLVRPRGEVRCLAPGRAAAVRGRGLDAGPDVLDTWFSRAVAVLTFGWPDDTADLRHYYPTSVLVTGYDILSSGSPDDDARAVRDGWQPPFEHVSCTG